MVLVQRRHRQWKKNREPGKHTHMELWGMEQKGEQFTVKGKNVK